MTDTVRRKHLNPNQLTASVAANLGFYEDPLSGKTVLRGSNARRSKSAKLVVSRDFAGSARSADERAERHRRNAIRGKDLERLMSIENEQDDDGFDTKFESPAVTEFWDENPSLNRDTLTLSELFEYKAQQLKSAIEQQASFEVRGSGSLADVLAGKTKTTTHSLDRRILIDHFKAIPADLVIQNHLAQEFIMGWLLDLLDMYDMNDNYRPQSVSGQSAINWLLQQVAKHEQAFGHPPY